MDLIELKAYKTLKLTTNYSKRAVLSLKTVGGKTIAKAGGWGYDKRGTVFKALFEKLGFDIEDVWYTKFDLTNYPIEDANQFLANNGINYKVNYSTKINDQIEFIELKKLLTN